MREIKFRAWDKTDKIMLQPYSGCISDGKVFMSCKSGNEFELMQYTGLKDKNDKEIYEGDIVKFPLFDNNEVICYLHREVIFHNGMFKIKPIKEGNYGMPREEDEVIGNIHQNPEVLTHSETKVNIMEQENHSQYRIEPKEFIQGDCIEVLKKRKDIRPDLIITDPPYNIGWNYSKEVNDNKKDYHEWCLEWAELCFERLDYGGVFCIINYPENNNILYTQLIKKGYNFIQQLIWNYPTNIGHSKSKYTKSYRTILVFSKGKPNIFNPMKQPYKNPTDKRIKKRIAEGHKGVTHYDVFTFNLCKNVSKSKENNGINQLPDDLVRMLVSTYSDYHDIVLDPFVGNGTVTRIAWDMARGAYGIDINDYRKRNIR